MATKENSITFEDELLEHRQKIRNVKNQMARAMLDCFLIPDEIRPVVMAKVTARYEEKIFILEKEWKKKLEQKRRIKLLEKLQDFADELTLWGIFERRPDDPEISVVEECI